LGVAPALHNSSPDLVSNQLLSPESLADPAEQDQKQEVKEDSKTRTIER
jgi:hypothetical protein